MGVDVQGLLGFTGRDGNPGSIPSFGSKGAGLLTCRFLGHPPLGIPELSGVPIVDGPSIKGFEGLPITAVPDPTDGPVPQPPLGIPALSGVPIDSFVLRGV